MPRRTPTAILDARGSFINHPGRKRPNEPFTNRPIGPPPNFLKPAEKKVWKQLVKQALPGVLMESDRLMFSVLVRLANRHYTGAPMMVGEIAQLITLSGKFALNAADRAKVQIDQPKKSNLAIFLEKKAARAS